METKTKGFAETIKDETINAIKGAGEIVGAVVSSVSGVVRNAIRAAEAGLPLVRVSANGYSALIDQTGRVVKKTKLDTEEILQGELFVPDSTMIGGEDPKNPLLDEVKRTERPLEIREPPVSEVSRMLIFCDDAGGVLD